LMKHLGQLLVRLGHSLKLLINLFG